MTPQEEMQEGGAENRQLNGMSLLGLDFVHLWGEKSIWMNPRWNIAKKTHMERKSSQQSFNKWMLSSQGSWNKQGIGTLSPSC